jgi:hypothetical protein
MNVRHDSAPGADPGQLKRDPHDKAPASEFIAAGATDAMKARETR